MSRTRAAAGILCALLIVIALTSCHRGAAATAEIQSAEADGARGIVQVVGSEPLTTIILVPAPGMPGETLILVGADTARLRPLSGLELVVSGRRLPAVTGALPRPTPAMNVSKFVVRAANGVAAVDGVVVEDGGRFYIVDAGRVRHEAPHLPLALRLQAGTRVYLIGPLGAAPVGYGAIRSP